MSLLEIIPFVNESRAKYVISSCVHVINTIIGSIPLIRYKTDTRIINDIDDNDIDGNNVDDN